MLPVFLAIELNSQHQGDGGRYNNRQTEIDIDPDHIQDREEQKQADEPGGEIDQVLGLDAFELNASVDSLVDIVNGSHIALCWMTGAGTIALPQSNGASQRTSHRRRDAGNPRSNCEERF